MADITSELAPNTVQVILSLPPTEHYQEGLLLVSGTFHSITELVELSFHFYIIGRFVLLSNELQVHPQGANFRFHALKLLLPLQLVWRRGTRDGRGKKLELEDWWGGSAMEIEAMGFEWE